MPSIETSIWLALRARVETVVLSPALPVAWPNESFTPPPGGFLRCTWIPNRTRRLMIRSDAPQQRPGLLLIDVMAKKNQNMAVALEIAGRVAAHFPTDLRMTFNGVAVRVTKAPDISQPLPDDTFLIVPVTISVEAFA